MHTFHCECRCSCGSHIEWDGSWEMLGAGLAKGYGSRAAVLLSRQHPRQKTEKAMPGRQDTVYL